MEGNSLICPPCRQGGALNADAARVTDNLTAALLEVRALESHGECWYRDCTCQHQVGVFLAQAAR